MYRIWRRWRGLSGPVAGFGACWLGIAWLSGVSCCSFRKQTLAKKEEDSRQSKKTKIMTVRVEKTSKHSKMTMTVRVDCEEVESASPLLLASTVSALTLPELLPIIPRPTVSSSMPTSSSALPNSIRFWSLRSSVWAYASFCFRALRHGVSWVRLFQNTTSYGAAIAMRVCVFACWTSRVTHRFPPRFLRFVSCGMGKALAILLGGGSAILSIFFCNSPKHFLP